MTVAPGGGRQIEEEEEEDEGYRRGEGDDKKGKV